MKQVLVWLLLLPWAIASLRAAGSDAGALFALNCAPCHGKDGRARTPAARKLGVKDLTLSRISDAEIARQIRDGRKDKRGKQQMPSFGERLSEDDVSQLVTFVKKFRR